ncbi:dehydration-responsive element-binding protein 1B [Quercus suber]|uniref:dehydration-responsive element-binding protein 1B n=1 Tax=Quercus suber TaxID=58331 RepID=UPI0032DEC454
MDIFAEYISFDSACMMNLSDEEVMLAFRNPKKRDGRKKFKETKHLMYRGVRNGEEEPTKWVFEVHEPNKKLGIWLEIFPITEMTACAHDVATIVLHSRYACLNFTNSVWRILVRALTTAKDIQRATLEAAESFRLAELDNVETEAEVVFFIDEEVVFSMPRLLINMAKGMLLPPPHCYSGDDMKTDGDVSLWNYSI